MGTDRISRRDFVEVVGGSAALLAVVATNTAVAANDKVRMGLIGAGGRGTDLLKTFLKNPEVDFVAIADVDDQHAQNAAAIVKDQREHTPATTRDYRSMLDSPDVDAVIIATPDHWHALPAIHAVLAGKDVYVEKPVGHNVAEGQAMIRAARKTNRIMAVGTQQRSSDHFRRAVETVKSGKLGKVFWIETWYNENISPVGIGRPCDTFAPFNVEYDRWLGPAPQRPFNPNRFHLLFRWFFDYAGGMLSDWGVHLNDIALWALDAKAPRSVSATGGIFTSDDNRDTPDTLQVVYEFPACTLTFSMRKGNGLRRNGHYYGILFCGTDGSLMLDRNGYEIIPDKIDLPYGIKRAQGNRALRQITLQAEKVKGDDGEPKHAKNFLECLRTRQRPICDIEIGHHSTNTCHLGNIAYRLGRKLFWDEVSETFKNDPEANALLAREPRHGYELPYT